MRDGTYDSESPLLHQMLHRDAAFTEAVIEEVLAEFRKLPLETRAKIAAELLRGDEA